MGYNKDFFADYKAIEGIRSFTQADRKKGKEIKKVKKFDISCLADQLKGKKFKYEVTGTDKVVKKTVRIVDIYSHQVICEYIYGIYPNIGFLKIGISLADLIECGVISFVKGYPEVLI